MFFKKLKIVCNTIKHMILSKCERGLHLTMLIGNSIWYDYFSKPFCLKGSRSKVKADTMLTMLSFFFVNGCILARWSLTCLFTALWQRGISHILNYHHHLKMMMLIRSRI